MIFLDFDGVIAPIVRWDRYEDLDPACVKRLNEIVASTGAGVVVSSTHRHGKSVAELQELLAAAGFIGDVRDKTPAGAPGDDRGDEIATWLAAHPVAGYVILDDHVVDVGTPHTHLVLTQSARGLQPGDVALAIDLLRRPLHAADGGPS